MAADGGPAVDLRDESTVRAAFFQMLVDWHGTDLKDVYEPLTDQIGYLYTLFLVILGVGIVVGLYRKWYRKKREATIQYKVIKPPANLTIKDSGSGSRKRVVAVTGSTGFVGKRVVQRLVESGEYIVYALGRNFMDNDIISMSDAVFQVDMMDYEGLQNAFAGVDTVIHAAAATPNVYITKDDIWRLNVTGSENLLSAAVKCGVKNLVLVSALVPAKKLSNEITNTYFNAQGHVDRLFTEANGQNGIRVCSLRFGAIYGLNPFYNMLLAGKFSSLPFRDDRMGFMLLRQVADVVIKAEKKLHDGDESVAGKIFSIMGYETTTRELFTCPEWGTKTIKEGSMKPLLIAAKMNSILANTIGYAPMGLKMSPASTAIMQIDSLEEFDPLEAHNALELDPMVTIEEGVRELKEEFEKMKNKKRD